MNTPQKIKDKSDHVFWNFFILHVCICEELTLGPLKFLSTQVSWSKLFFKKGLSTLSQSFSFSKIAWTCAIKISLSWPIQPGK